MKILLTGSNGQVGTSIQDVFAALQGTPGCRYAIMRSELSRYPWNEATLIATTKETLDITDKAALSQMMDEMKPDYIINAAAYTAVDKAEEDKLNCTAVNTTAVQLLSEIAAEHDIPVLHFSTEYVFDGEKKDTYLEEDKTGPVNFYGQSKLLGEQAITTHPLHYVLRVNWIFSPYGSNFVKTIINKAKEVEELNIVADQFGAPTSALDIAEVALLMLQKEALSAQKHYGIYHYTSEPFVNWCEFAEAIIYAAQAKDIQVKVKAIHAIATSDYPTKALRQKNSKLSVAKLTRTFGILPKPWTLQLPGIIETLSD